MRPAPVVWMVLGYGAGLATGLARFPAPVIVASALVVAAVATRRRERLGLWVGAALVGQGAAFAAWRGEAGSCAAMLRRGEVRVTIVPIDPPPVERGRVEAKIIGRDCHGAIAVRWPTNANVEVGAAVDVTGTWLPRPDGAFKRPGGTLIVRQSAPDLGLRTSHLLEARRLLLATSSRLYGDRAPLVDALLFDRHGAIDRDTLDRFAASGLIHLLSISGFHVGLVVGWLWLVLRAARLRREWAWVIATVAGVAYVAWIGWPPPATRAAALAGVLCVARLRQRSVRWDALLAITALAVLLLDPWAIADLGAWLSVASLGGATYATRWSDLRFGKGVAARTLSGSIGSSFATAPITAAALGRVSLAGLLLNFIGIPLAAVALPAVILSLLLAPLSMPVATAMAAGGGALLAGLDRLAAFGAIMPYGHFVVEAGWQAALPWTFLLAGTLWIVSDRATRELAFLRMVLLAGSALWVSNRALVWRPSAGHPPGGVTITFLDVGQGDAAVIETPHGHWLEVDAGPEGEGADAGRRVVAPFLESRGVRRLDAMILSHAHRDHYGGMPAVMDRIAVDRFLEPGEVVDDPGYRILLDRVAASGAEWHAIRRGDTVAVDGLTIAVLHPDTAWSDWGLDLNEDSAVLLLRYGRFSALLVGDAGFPAESAMGGMVGDIDLLKVGHHGSAGSSGEAWLAKLRPEVAVVSVGAHNRYHHPSAGALGRLGAVRAAVLRTDLVGNVEVWTDGTTYRVASRAGSRVLPAGPPSP